MIKLYIINQLTINQPLHQYGEFLICDLPLYGQIYHFWFTFPVNTGIHSLSITGNPQHPFADSVYSNCKMAALVKCGIYGIFKIHRKNVQICSSFVLSCYSKIIHYFALDCNKFAIEYCILYYAKATQ